MNYKILSLIITLSAFLYGCGGGGGGGSSNAVVAQVASCTGSSGKLLLYQYQILQLLKTQVIVLL